MDELPDYEMIVLLQTAMRVVMFANYVDVQEALNTLESEVKFQLDMAWADRHGYS